MQEPNCRIVLQKRVELYAAASSHFQKKHIAIVCVIPSIKSEFLIIVDLSIMQVITIILLYAGLT